jgi:hypothetical protein
MPNLLPFVDEFAPVWTDPLTGITKPMTAAGWIAAGFEVAGPTRQGYWVVNLDSRRAAIEPPVPGREYEVDPRRGHDAPPDPV